MKTARLITLLGILFAVLGLATASFIPTGRAVGQPPATLTPTPTPTNDLQESPANPSLSPFGDEQFWVVRAYYPDRQMVNELAQWLEPWEVHHDQGFLVVGVNQAEFDLLQMLGFRLEIDQAATQKFNQPRLVDPNQTQGIPSYPCYRTVEETFNSAQALVAAYPNLATWLDIGDSWDKAQFGATKGYDLMVLRLTNSAIPGPKPKLFLMASIHAREYTPAELATRFAEYLLSNYDHNADITWLLDYQEIHLLLQSNPDGRKKAEAGMLWRKNTNQNYCGPTSKNRGADLNRNFEFGWGCCGGSSGSPCNDIYRGPSAASEPETQAVQNYVRAEFPDQRDPALSDPAPDTASGVFLDIHSFSSLVLWPWGFTYNAAPNHTALQTLGRKLAFFNSYTPEQSSTLYFTDGTTDDFAYGDLGVAAYTFELGTDFFEECPIFENQILPDNLASLLYAAKATRAPYLIPAGPEVVSLTFSAGTVAQGEPLQFTANLSDMRYNNTNGVEPYQNIIAAEYYIDIPPWSTEPTPVANPMSASDGAFDHPIEFVQAAIDTRFLAGGRHILFVRGQDANGNWGAITAGFINIYPYLQYLPSVFQP